MFLLWVSFIAVVDKIIIVKRSTWIDDTLCSSEPLWNYLHKYGTSEEYVENNVLCICSVYVAYIIAQMCTQQNIKQDMYF
jgi:hypothetical protein